MSRLLWFVLGIVVAFLALMVGGYLFLRSGGVSMETTASPLPLERTVARMALHASFGDAAGGKSPIPADEANLIAGADTYRTHCAVCHGLPGSQRSAIARGMFPDPPQLFDEKEMVTDDPEGITDWKVTHGIRLSGMPGFSSTLSDVQRWQVTLLVAHADKLSPAVQAALRQ
jgi:mono/diheme cytochrome c family protein